jgi:hypothetical protein
VITSGEPVPVLVRRSNRSCGYDSARRSRIAYVAISSFFRESVVFADADRDGHSWLQKHSRGFVTGARGDWR